MAYQSRTHVRDWPLSGANWLAGLDWRQARYRGRAYSLARWERVWVLMVLELLGGATSAVLAYYSTLAICALVRSYTHRADY